MGWCGATEIIDAAIKAAEELEDAIRDACCQKPPNRADLDDHLRPFVTVIAAQLREADWDCVDESEYFDRFPQEMSGWDDSEYANWLTEQIADDPLGSVKYAAALIELQNRKA